MSSERLLLTLSLLGACGAPRRRPRPPVRPPLRPSPPTIGPPISPPSPSLSAPSTPGGATPRAGTGARRAAWWTSAAGRSQTPPFSSAARVTPDSPSSTPTPRAAEPGNPTDRIWLALELAAGDAEGEDGPTDRGESQPDAVQEDTWRAAAHYLPELRLIGAEPAFDLGSYHLGEAARGLLALRARPEDDALVAPLRHPPAAPVRAPTPEARCAPWQRAWAGAERLPVEELPAA